MSTLREIDSPFLLEPKVTEQFTEQGFVHLKRVLSSQSVATYEQEIDQKVVDLNTMHLRLEERSTYDKAFLQVGNLWRQSDLVREFVFCRRLADIARALLGVGHVRLYQDQALYKEPGGGVTPWHADQYYWPFSSDRVCTAWVPLQATPAKMGPLEFAAGSHRFDLGRDLAISDDSEALLQKVLSEQDFTIVSEPYGLGDVSYHLGWTLHHAQPNHSVSPRRVMTIVYMDAKITVAEPVNDHQRTDLAELMPGASIGSVPDTPLNPVLS
jgi:ectoine hydroxylase-related dioxygenase (phytanoyl-CoA dioxygenase family)